MSYPSVLQHRAPSVACGICLAVLAAFSPQPARAQVELGPVVVTATREAQPLALVSADVVLIDSATIRESSATTLEDLLRQHAGVQLSRNGGPGQSASVLIRGSAASSTVVLVDGVRVGSATLGQTALESISLSQIERLEILRGPASSLYGADAVGGVVQIFTRRGEAGQRLTARLAVGTQVSKAADATFSGATQGFDYFVGASHDSSDGVSAKRPGDLYGEFNPDRDGFRRNAVRLGAGFTPFDGQRFGLLVMESRNDAQYDASDFETQDNSPDFHSRLRSRLLSIDHQARVNRVWNSSFKLARNDDDSNAGGTTINRFLTRRDQASWQNSLDLAAGQQLVVALERIEERVEGTPFASRLERNNNALVLGYSGRFGVHVLQADLRHDDNSIYGGVDTGRIGYSVELARGLRLRALAGTSFRAPTFNDLFYPGYGVATVEPERGRSVELGLNWSQGHQEVALTVFRNRVSKLIAYESDRSRCPAAAAYNFGCARNINQATLQGANIAAAQAWGGFRLRAAIDLLDATDSRTGVRLDRRAAHQESLIADYRPGGPWSIGATLMVIGARPDGGITLARETTLDLRAVWRLAKQWQIEASLLNASDRDLQPARDYQGLGRQAWIGLRYDGEGI